MTQQSYPVFVETTERRLVWVGAENADEAAKRVNSNPTYWTEKAEVHDGWWTATTPKSAYDWEEVYGWTGAAEEQDNHVQVHKAMLYRREQEAKRAACHEARHPDTEVYPSGSIWCRGCTDYLYIANGVDR